MQSNFAINNPHKAPMASPIYHKAAKFNELINQVLDSALSSYDDSSIDINSSPLNSKYLPVFTE